MSKLVHIFTKESYEKNWYDHKERNGYVTSEVYCTTYYGAFDDGTWEPLFRYAKYDEEKTLNIGHVKGVRGATREHLIEVLEKLYYYGNYKTLTLLIGN